MAYFNFSQLINRYSREFKLITKDSNGYDDKGDCITEVKTEKTMIGAIIGVDEKKLYRENSTLTIKDKNLYMLEEIPKSLRNADIIFNENKYKIEQEKIDETAEFTGVFCYVLKWVSAFND